MTRNKGKRKGVKINALPRENEEMSAQEMQNVRGGAAWQAQPNPALQAAQAAVSQLKIAAVTASGEAGTKGIDVSAVADAAKK